MKTTKEQTQIFNLVRSMIVLDKFDILTDKQKDEILNTVKEIVPEFEDVKVTNNEWSIYQFDTFYLAMKDDVEPLDIVAFKDEEEIKKYAEREIDLKTEELKNFDEVKDTKDLPESFKKEAERNNAKVKEIKNKIQSFNNLKDEVNLWSIPRV